MADDNGARLAFKLPWHEQIADNFHAVLIAETHTIQPDVVVDGKGLEIAAGDFCHGGCGLFSLLPGMCLGYGHEGDNAAKKANTQPFNRMHDTLQRGYAVTGRYTVHH